MNPPSLAGSVTDRIRTPILTLGLAAFIAIAAPTRTSAAPPKMGVYLTHGDEAAIVRYETWTKQTMAPIVDFAPDDNWEALSGVTEGYGLSWGLNQWTTAYRSRILVSIPMLPKSGAVTSYGQYVPGQPTPVTPTLALGASGTYDHHWRNAADTLIAKGYANATIRIGWEFNGDWFRWHTNNPTEAASYKAYWKRIVLAMRSRPGANFKFNWCGANGDQPSGINPALAYPDTDANGSYVDEIGVDIYDVNWGYYPIDPAWPQWQKDSNRTNAWLACSQWGTYNLNWWAAFAASKGKPMTIPEWGLADGPASIHGGGDNPIFIQKFHEWLIDPARNVSWHAYFQEDVSFASKIFEDTAPATFPEATAKFLQLFSGRPSYILFQNPINNVAWTGGYGARSATVVGTDGSHKPFEGAQQYKITYTTIAGIQLGFSQQNLSQATHLRFAVKGPIANSSQYFFVRLYASDGTYGQMVQVARTTAYTIVEIPMSSLSSGLNLAQVNSLYFYPVSSPSGVSDTFYIDNIVFTKTTP